MPFLKVDKSYKNFPFEEFSNSLRALVWTSVTDSYYLTMLLTTCMVLAYLGLLWMVNKCIHRLITPPLHTTPLQDVNLSQQHPFIATFLYSIAHYDNAPNSNTTDGCTLCLSFTYSLDKPFRSMFTAHLFLTTLLYDNTTTIRCVPLL